MKKKKIILPRLRYENAPDIDSQIQIGFDEEKSLLRIDDRDIVLDLAEQFASERAASKKYMIYGKMKMVFRNLYAGATPYPYLRERLSLASDGSDGNFCGFLPYNEFAFLRDDIYHETTAPVSVDALSGFTEFTFITSGSTEHTAITNLTAPYHNWNIYLSYVFDHEVNFPMKYTLSGETIPPLSFVSGDGIPFRVEETTNEYVLTSPVKHGISQGEYIVINEKYYYVNSVGNSLYDSENYVINILKTQFYNTTLGPLITGKRCTDISDKDNSTSEYYVHKHKTLTKATENYTDNVGFESPIWEDEQKLLFQNSAGINDALVVRNKMESILFYFKEPFILSGITNNLGYTPTDIYTSVVFRNGNGLFLYPPKVGYSFHMHDTWIDSHFDGNNALETGITYTDFYRNNILFHGGDELPIGTELFGAFVEYNPKEMKERIISEAFHKIISDPLIFNHAQTLSSTYYGATETNPIGLLYQPHYRFKLRELSPYVETSDINTPMYNLPENAVYFPNEKIWRWRDLYEDGYVDPDGYGTDYPYLNDKHYIHKDVNFYLRNEQIYNNKKDGIISFYKKQDVDECSNDSIAYLRGYITPSLSNTSGLFPSISPSLSPSSSTLFVPLPSIIPDAIYVAPEPYGNDTLGNGSVDSPFFTLNKAWEFVSDESRTIYMRGGTYYYNERQHLQNKSGVSGDLIKIFAYPGEKPIINRGDSFTYPIEWPSSFIFIENCDYFYIKGIDISYYTQITSSPWEGMRAYNCNNSIFESLDIHHNGGGFQLSSCNNCIVLNSDFHHNQDPLTTTVGHYRTANGFGIDRSDNTINAHNSVKGCRFYWNSNDGANLWDDEGSSTFENCWSFWNGYVPDTYTLAGSGNGFTLGRTQISQAYVVLRHLFNNISFENRRWGFIDNGALCNMVLYNNTAYNNGNVDLYPTLKGGFCFNTRTDIPFYLKNNISFINGNEQALIGNTTNTEFNTWDSSITATVADFESVSTNGVDGSRSTDGNLPLLDFLKLKSTSDLIWAGTTPLTSTDALGYEWHTPPSLGTYEYIPVPITPTITPTITPSISMSRTPSISITPTLTASNIPLGTFYLSPDGNDTFGDGSIENPWYSITKAMGLTKAGDLVYMRGGEYNYTSEQLISGKNGYDGNTIKLWAYPGEIPIVNRGSSAWSNNRGIYVRDCSYIHIKGLEVVGYTQPASDEWGNGIVATDVRFCIFEQLKCHDNCFGMSLIDDDGITTGNLILNSDFYSNEDPITSFPAPYDDLQPYGNADGLTIRCGNSTATVNTVRGCRFYWNSDDGIDLWGNEGLIELDGCQSFYNGYYKNTFTPCGGDGNGFKLGETEISNIEKILRKVHGCVAYRNTAWGFHRNGALCNMEIYNNTAYNNTIGGFYFTAQVGGDIPFYIKNNISFGNGQYNYALGTTTQTNISNNSWDLPVSVTDVDFLSVTPTDITADRTSNGLIQKIPFLHLTNGDLLYVGQDVGLTLDGDQLPWHTPPSIGSFEYEIVSPSRTPSRTKTPSITRTPSRTVTPSITRTPTRTPSRSGAQITSTTVKITNNGSKNITNITFGLPSPNGVLIPNIAYPITPGRTITSSTTYVINSGNVYIYMDSSYGEVISVNGSLFTTNGNSYYSFTNINTTGGIIIEYKSSGYIVADHTHAKYSDFLAIPSSVITAAKSSLHIVYEHSSHGRQIVQGMTGLAASPMGGSTFLYNTGGIGGALDLRDNGIAKMYSCWGADIGNARCPDLTEYELWATNTRKYLALNPGINVVMWSWCGQCSFATEANINQYLTLMNQLEIDYPDIKFVYMTGHVDGTALTSNLYRRNAQIRNYCASNNKILFDFADIESYDPDGNYYGDKRPTDCCNYDYNGDGIVNTNGADPGYPVSPDRNWALDYQNTHTLDTHWFNCSSSHSFPLNANMKAYAAWWLWARLTGWNEVKSSIPESTLLSARYVSNSGSDLNNGLTPSTPWKTIDKVNSEFPNLPVGTSVLFKRDDTFYGTITIGKSGTIDNPMTIGAYGTGNKPKITGLTTIPSTSWVNNGDGRYYSPITINQRTFVVLVDGVLKEMGRYPNSGSNLTYESFTITPTKTITDTTLGDSVNWTGAELVINKLDYVRSRCLITAHNGNVLTYSEVTSNDNIETANRPYFIQNDLRCVTTTDEWYHDTVRNRLYIYGNPSGKVVQVATLTNLIYNNYNHIIIDGLDLVGSIGNAVEILYRDGIIVRNCTISFAGKMGVSMKAKNSLIEHNTIQHVNDWGVYCEDTNITVYHNLISHVGLLPGLTSGRSGQGIVTSGGNSNSIFNISYNTIQYIGYNGIHARYLFNIHHNFFYRVCENLTDGGAVYCGTERSEPRYIDSNIVLYSGSRGLYIDEPVSNVHVTNNVVAYCTSSGYHIHKGHNNTHINNLSFDCKYGIWYQDSTGLLTYDNISQNNKYISKLADQYSLYVSSGLNNLTGYFSTANGNYYARPTNTSATVLARQPDFGTYRYYTVPQWKTFVSPLDSDANSNLGGTVTSTNDLHFIYNETENDKRFTLSSSMKDVQGNTYSGTITLNPWKGMVLIGTGTVSQI